MYKIFYEGKKIFETDDYEDFGEKYQELLNSSWRSDKLSYSVADEPKKTRP